MRGKCKKNFFTKINVQGSYIATCIYYNHRSFIPGERDLKIFFALFNLYESYFTAIFFPRKFMYVLDEKSELQYTKLSRLDIV